jgi:hypothetical protein
VQRRFGAVFPVWLTRWQLVLTLLTVLKSWWESLRGRSTSASVDDSSAQPPQWSGVIRLPMPADFPTAAYEAIFRRIRPENAGPPDPVEEEFAQAWLGVAYRFLACSDHDATFTRSLRSHGGAPPMAERNVQERALFEFFVNALSSLECFCYGMYFVGNRADPTGFPERAAEKLRSIAAGCVRRRYGQTFQDERLTSVLDQVLSSDEFKQLKLVRDRLAHRGSYPRKMFVGGPISDPEWRLVLQFPFVRFLLSVAFGGQRHASSLLVSPGGADCSRRRQDRGGRHGATPPARPPAQGATPRGRLSAGG